jgi:hypothetical protein
VFLVLMVSKDLLVHKVIQVPQGRKDLLELKVIKATKETKDLLG